MKALKSFLLVRTKESKAFEFRDVPIDHVPIIYGDVVEWWIVVTTSKKRAKELTRLYPNESKNDERVVEYGLIAR